MIAQGSNPLGGTSRKGKRNRFTAYLYILLALVLMVFDASGSRLPSVMRSYATDLIYPVLVFFERPVRALQDGLERVAGASDIYQENERLKSENVELRRWRLAAEQFMRENEQLHRMLKVPGREVPIAATARVIGIGGGAFQRNFLIGAGQVDGVRMHQPVVDDRGVVGRVQSTSRWTARVLLVTDINSRIPVLHSPSGAVAIAEGLNNDLLRLAFLPEGVQVKVGDLVVTSGHGGLFPANLPLAQVVEVSENTVLMKPTGLFNKIDHVRVLNYASLLNQGEPQGDGLKQEEEDG
ncbi:rod shape-determining protein MreC [Temperatibacter marinus]|uniref:Cell shape-determining protein MreC n=1 Tax=Temperatibacter marinus TaxID=1456591 RepID=A0AA52HAM7_9PROT|nr:rod shape-determining protein MreC [Temperatibacter marinus]WND02768.1 rod shape-determining protein MreC [Temperatibacter marinus]